MYKEIEPTKSNTIHSPDLSKSPESVKYIPYGQLEGQKWSGALLGLLKLKHENVSWKCRLALAVIPQIVSRHEKWSEGELEVVQHGEVIVQQKCR